MTIQVDVRQALKTALAGVDSVASVYTSFPATAILPFVAMIPATPYLEPLTIGSGVKVRVNLALTLAVEPYDNEAALDNIEKLAVSVLAALPVGYTVGDVSNPMPMVLQSGTECIACEINVSTHYEQ